MCLLRHWWTCWVILKVLPKPLLITSDYLLVMHYHQAYWSIQALVSCFSSPQLFFTLHALGQYGLAGWVVWDLSWTSMRHTYLVAAVWSALQRLTSLLHPWASALWSALRKSTWPHYQVLVCVPAVLWHACQLCCDTVTVDKWRRWCARPF